ncbi:hypothetical protein BDZ94DRAFT_94857 [Collybia nuda]|uniref:Uncharacterized protein n=1 Tax=Collybia nuda TaxID=64659 RepID=A0A9P6CI60_9AGAR|nr:hypothetical protein BDZ94DRAFT_94857 [Collybia nuda]
MNWSLALLVIFFTKKAQSKRKSVDWVRPKDLDSYSPGDSIIGEWNTESPILSPSFRLCRSSSNDMETIRPGIPASPENSGDCGSAIWPPVTQSATSYSISLVAPKTRPQGKYILRMEDKFGSQYDSANFSLIPSTSFVATIGDLPVTDLPQAPLSTRPTKGNTTQSDDKISPTMGLVPGVPRPSVNNSSSPSPNGSAPGSLLHIPLSAGGSATPSTTSSVPNLLVARRTVATAAYVIPLAVFAAILFVAGGLAIRQRFKLQEEHRKDAMKLSVSRQSSHESVRDIEHGLITLAKEDSMHSVQAPVPLFMPAEAHIMPKCSIPKPLSVPQHLTPPSRAPTKLSRPPSTRSILSSGFHLPLITTSSTGFFDGHDGVTHSVISGYFEPSPPVSPSQLPSVPKKLHLRDRTMTQRN